MKHLTETKWNDNNRFNQTGYSGCTEFPNPYEYANLDLFLEDITKAVRREQSHREFLWEQYEEGRIDYLEYKYENEEWE